MEEVEVERVLPPRDWVVLDLLLTVVVFLLLEDSLTSGQTWLPTAYVEVEDVELDVAL